jgi:rRNA biogenesis protein RRP5
MVQKKVEYLDSRGEMFSTLRSLSTMAPIHETKRKVGPASGGNERPAKISKIREEDAPFPRGGASLLTPLEHKQIQIEATRDVLFEQQGAKSKKPDADGDDGQTERKEKKSKSKKKSKKGTQATEPDEETVKIEGLSYKVCSLCALSTMFQN